MSEVKTNDDGLELSGTYEMLIKNSSGEAEVHELKKYSKKANTAIEELKFLQASPVTVRPSRAKPVKRDFTRIIAFGDQQIGYREYDDELHPIHDESAIAATRLLARDCDILVCLGDTIDLPELSRFDPDSNHFNHRTLQASFNRVHKMYAEFRADNPTKEIHEVDSNHNSRLSKVVLKQLGVLRGFTPPGVDEEYSMLTYPFMANLKKLGIIWHSGYDAAEYYPFPDLAMRHGKEIRSAGSTAEMLSKRYPYSNIVVGHGHQAQMHVRTKPDGTYLTAVQVGTLAKITGEVPSYHNAIDDHDHPIHKYENWQQSVMIIDRYADGHYNFQHVFIKHGVAYFEGKRYDGNN
jgi:hypothetical protein